MKKLIQLSLISLLILISVFFYNFYFLKNSEKSKVSKNKIDNETLINDQNNLIRNLKYEVKFDNNTQYIIKAELSELTYNGDVEIVKMQKVTAKFTDQDDTSLIIMSDNADYNNSNYNTEFSTNVSIKYGNNQINSENLDLNFTENIVRIYNNVVYDGLNSSVKTDNVKIDLINKKVNIFMNDSTKKVKFLSK